MSPSNQTAIPTTNATERIEKDPQREALKMAAVDHEFTDQFTGQKVIVERAVYAVWFKPSTREKLFDLYVSLITWESYGRQLIARYGQPDVLLHSDEIYAHRRAGQAAVRARANTRVISKARKLSTTKIDQFYTVDLVKKKHDNVTLFRYI